jgi:serine O-acetyltransferase
MKTFSFQSKIGFFILCYIQKYNHEKYWCRRNIVINPKNNTNILIKLYYLNYIKKVDAYHNCSFGTNLNSGTIFDSPPHLPHGPKGIIIGHDLHIGRNVTIFHQVTLAHGKGIIGSNVLFGAGSKLMGGYNVGDNVKIGANAVVIENIPDNATVVLPKPRIIKNRVNV